MRWKWVHVLAVGVDGFDAVEVWFVVVARDVHKFCKDILKWETFNRILRHQLPPFLSPRTLSPTIDTLLLSFTRPILTRTRHHPLILKSQLKLLRTRLLPLTLVLHLPRKFLMNEPHIFHPVMVHLLLTPSHLRLSLFLSLF